MPELNLPSSEQVPGNAWESISSISYVDPDAALNPGAMYLSITDSSGALSASYAGSPLPGSGTNTLSVSANYDTVSAALSSLTYRANIASGSDIISFDLWNQYGVETTGSIPVTIGTSPPTNGWVQSWAASPEPPDIGGDLAPSFNNQTIREVIRLSGGGTSIRLRFSDQFRSTPLFIGSVHVGLIDSNGAIIAGTDHALTFGGSSATEIAAGSTASSDPLSFATDQNATIAVSIYLPQNTGPVTWNQFGDISPIVSGNQTGATSLTSDDVTYSRPILSDAEVSGGGVDGAIVALGDSITVVEPDFNQNDRWTDDLSNRLQSAGVSNLAVVNAGISGNRILGDGTGPSALSRFSRDVASAPGAKYAIIEEGINDIGSGNASAQDLEQGYLQLINAAHAAGLQVFGTTLTPFGGSFYDTPAHEAVREAVNSWIRTSGEFDSVIDFDAAVHDTQNPEWWRGDYDNGSHLHPNIYGAQALANAIDLGLFGPTTPPPPVGPITTGSGPDTLVLHIAEDAYQGDAQFTVALDGVQLGGTFTATALQAAGATQDFIFKGDWSLGVHTVTVTFLNDAWDGTPTTDRNLYVDGASYDGSDTGQSQVLYSAGSKDFTVNDATPSAGQGTIIPIAPPDANPVILDSYVTIVATSGDHALFIGGTHDVAILTGGIESVQAYQGYNSITTGDENDTIRIGGSGNVVNAGAGSNTIEDSGSANTLVMPAAGRDDVSGYIIQNGDTIDLRPALTATAWDGQQATLGNFVHVGLSGNDTIITMTATANGAVSGSMDLHDSGALSFSGLLSHAIW